uniref:Uncharacterized protein n=1 Tax=Pyxicephalus adspersus TaxID=30357 RepID=A0AAV3A3Q8_PYXAD|nr:TPA: hypothetical protein GDO54_018326 [Pyxicephalus adspersus]
MPATPGAGSKTRNLFINGKGLRQTLKLNKFPLNLNKTFKRLIHPNRLIPKEPQMGSYPTKETWAGRLTLYKVILPSKCNKSSTETSIMEICKLKFIFYPKAMKCFFILLSVKQ